MRNPIVFAWASATLCILTNGLFLACGGSDVGEVPGEVAGEDAPGSVPDQVVAPRDERAVAVPAADHRQVVGDDAVSGAEVQVALDGDSSSSPVGAVRGILGDRAVGAAHRSAGAGGLHFVVGGVGGSQRLDFARAARCDLPRRYRMG